MRYLSYLIFLIIILLGVSFAVLNSDLVTLHYYTGSRQLPLSVVLVGGFVVGVVLGILLMSVKNIGLHLKVRKLRRQMAIHQKDAQ